MEQQKRPLPAEAESWLSEHPDVDRQDLEQVWKLSELADEPYEPDESRVAELRENVARRISTNGRRPLRLVKLPKPLGIAASIAFLIAVGTALWLRPIVSTAPPGAVATVILPDESTVNLNSGATIEYRRTFGWLNRSVVLRGEAFFDVSKADAEFQVSTFNGSVTVLGTQFNIRAWSDDRDPETTVYVDEGVVRVAAAAVPDGPVILKAGQWSTIAGDSAPTTPVPIVNRDRPIWSTGGLVVTDRPLQDVLGEVSRLFDVDVTVSQDSLSDVRVSLHLANADDLGTVLEMIAEVHDLDIVQTEQGFKLASK
jgi:ferric-dicitrate binding protein FerR (iron transport regulator)